MTLNDLTFSKVGNVYRASFQPTGDFIIHIKRNDSGKLRLLETITGQDPVGFLSTEWRNKVFETKVIGVISGMTIVIESETDVVEAKYAYEE